MPHFKHVKIVCSIFLMITCAAITPTIFASKSHQTEKELLNQRGQPTSIIIRPDGAKLLIYQTKIILPNNYRTEVYTVKGAGSYGVNIPQSTQSPYVVCTTTYQVNKSGIIETIQKSSPLCRD